MNIDYRNEPVIALTLDTDWCPEFMLEMLLGIIGEAGLKITPFLTDDSFGVKYMGCQDQIDPENIGIHARIESHQRDDLENMANKLRYIYPEAVGFSSHAYNDSWYLSLVLVERGYLWDRNLFLWMQEGLFPLEHGSGMIRFPVWWEDDIWLTKKTDPPKILRNLALPGLKVINFHPKLVYENAAVSGILETIVENIGESYYLNELYENWRKTC